MTARNLLKKIELNNSLLIQEIQFFEMQVVKKVNTKRASKDGLEALFIIPSPGKTPALF